ncbi:MAG: hypothetical protein ACP6IT_10615, partial [Candidatus Thorarchaeota archaeon]
SYLVAGSGAIAELFTIDVLRSMLYGYGKLKAINAGYSTVACAEVGVTLQRIPRAFARRDIRAFVVNGIVVIDVEARVSQVGTHPQLGRYGVLEILLGHPEYMLVLVPAISEDVSKRPMLRRAIRYARAVIYTPKRLDALFSILYYATDHRRLRQTHTPGSYWPVIAAVTDSSRAVQLVLQNNLTGNANANIQGNENGTVLFATPYYAERMVSSLIGAFAAIGWTTAATQETGYDIHTSFLVVGGSSRRAFYSLESLVRSLMDRQVGTGEDDQARALAKSLIEQTSVYMIRRIRPSLMVPVTDRRGLISGTIDFHYRDSLGATELTLPLTTTVRVFMGVPHLKVLGQIGPELQVVVVSGDEFHPLTALNWIFGDLTRRFHTEAQLPIRLVVLVESIDEAKTCAKMITDFMEDHQNASIIPLVVPRPLVVASSLSALVIHGEHRVRKDNGRNNDENETQAPQPTADGPDIRLPLCRVHCPAGRQLADMLQGQVRASPCYWSTTHEMATGSYITYGCSMQDIHSIRIMFEDLLMDREPDDAQDTPDHDNTNGEAGDPVSHSAYITVCLGDAAGSLRTLLACMEKALCPVPERQNENAHETTTLNVKRDILEAKISPCNQLDPRNMVSIVWVPAGEEAARSTSEAIVRRLYIVCSENDPSWEIFAARLAGTLTDASGTETTFEARVATRNGGRYILIEPAVQDLDMGRRTCLSGAPDILCPVTLSEQIAPDLSDRNMCRQLDGQETKADDIQLDLDIVVMSTAGHCYGLQSIRGDDRSGSKIASAWVSMVARIRGRDTPPE